MQYGVEKLMDVTWEGFLEASRDRKAPVLISHGAAESAACRTWSSEYVCHKYPEITIVVSSSVDGTYRGDQEKGFVFFEEMTVSEFFSHVRCELPANKQYYWQQQGLVGHFADLARDLTTIPLLRRFGQGVIPYLWFGPASTTSPLHYDSADNMFVQVLGEKEFYLFDPKQTEFLYPYPAESAIAHLSQVDPRRPSHENFPLFQFASYNTLKVMPGDILFIPKGWWHHVTSNSVSASVSFWADD